MRGQFLIAAGLTLLAAAAHAQQQQPSDTSTSTSTSSASSASTKTNNPTLPGSTSNVPAPGPGNVGTTTSSLPVRLWQLKPPALKLILSSQTDMSRTAAANNDLNTVGKTPTQINFVGASYALTESRTLNLRQEFAYTFGGRKNGLEERGQAKLRDTFIGLNDTNLASFAGDGSLTGIARVYLPTGEESRFLTGRQGMLLGWLIANKPVGKWEFDAHFVAVYFNQSKDSYIDSNKPGVVNANIDYELNPFVGATYNIHPKLAVYHQVGTDNYWKRPIPGAGMQQIQTLDNETGFTYKPVAEVSINAALINSTNIWDNPKEFQMYRDEDSIYRLILKATM